MWPFSIDQEKRRLRQLKHCPPGPLFDFYSQPFPDKKTAMTDLLLVALDMELTGLDCQKDNVISIGLVEIKHLGIQLGTSWHQLIQTHQNIPEATAIIHKLTDDQVATGIELKKAIPMLLQRLQGKVLVAHHAGIELAFINKICRHYYHVDFFMPTIDTMQLAERRLKRQHELLATDALRLYNLRQHYQLPAYHAHNALSDALSTAELLLALMYDLYPQHDCVLSDLLLPDN